MSSHLRLRLLTRADLVFADSVRARVGWNQTLADWERFLANEPEGCFLAEWDGMPAGTATTTIYGSELAWIGMVIVHPDFRRQGIGRALLNRCIEYLRGRGVRSIKLDATPDGRPVYAAMGFRDEWTLTRWDGARGFSRDVPTPSVRPGRDSDWSAVDVLDREVFGAPRGRLLRLLAGQSRGGLVGEGSDRAVAGYGLLRDGARAAYLGPVVAATPRIGLGLVDAQLARAAGQQVYWDIPDANVTAAEHARQLGFTVQRTLTRMYLGENTTPGDPRRQFAIAGPEVG